ncbi:MarR family transcriptional regulator [Halosquirtibacter xylanolyticus]|uniref:MarR family winged helix-turn-helix transcriptional regulator n=1 Tax=Halosquirtibacter xylanolyticus TaxID=3374599 RepID=UPI0037489A1E|nr:MarR family transcriptional regulator [Prolixibacteraceae bacterium]
MEQLKISNQFCFPFYVASRMITKLYQPLLEQYGLTYPQYLVLMVLWEESPLPVKSIGEKLYLNSNTLTPLLKRMEAMELIIRTRDTKDERKVFIELTTKARELKSDIACVPTTLFEKLDMPMDKMQSIKKDLEDVIGLLNKSLSED